MKRTVIATRILKAFVAIIACALTAAAQESGSPNMRAADEAAIRANVKQMETGWNTKSGALFAKPFAEDADFVNLLGMYTKGRSVIEKGHQQILDTLFKNSTVKLSVKQIRFLRPDVALVHVSGRNKVQQGEETRELDGIATLVMTKDKDQWKIASLQNTRVENQQRR